MSKFLMMFVGVLLSLSIGIGSASADPALHGYCANGCIDNGINSPSIGQPSNFGFTISGGPTSGSLFFVDLLIPNRRIALARLRYTDLGSRDLFGHFFLERAVEHWRSGHFSYAQLGGSSPANPIGAFLMPLQVGHSIRPRQGLMCSKSTWERLRFRAQTIRIPRPF